MGVGTIFLIEQMSPDGWEIIERTSSKSRALELFNQYVSNNAHVRLTYRKAVK